MKRCEALKGDGTRCQSSAMRGSGWCWNHDPAKAEERKRNATRGGRAGGRGRSSLDETAQAKRHVKGIMARLIRGDAQMSREVAMACFTGFNVLARYIELERKIVEQEDLAERLDNMEEALDSGWGGGGIGHG